MAIAMYKRVVTKRRGVMWWRFDWMSSVGRSHSWIEHQRSGDVVAHSDVVLAFKLVVGIRFESVVTQLTTESIERRWTAKGTRIWEETHCETSRFKQRHNISYNENPTTTSLSENMPLKHTHRRGKKREEEEEGERERKYWLIWCSQPKRCSSQRRHKSSGVRGWCEWWSRSHSTIRSSNNHTVRTGTHPWWRQALNPWFPTTKDKNKRVSSLLRKRWWDSELAKFEWMEETVLLSRLCVMWSQHDDKTVPWQSDPNQSSSVPMSHPKWFHHDLWSRRRRDASDGQYVVQTQKLHLVCQTHDSCIWSGFNTREG